MFLEQATTKIPSEEDGDDSSSILCNVQERRLGQIKMLKRGIAPAAIVVRQSIIRRAKVGGSHSDGAREAPLRIIGATYLIACTAAQAIVEQSRA